MKSILLAATAFFFSVAVMAQTKAEDVIKMNVEKNMILVKSNRMYLSLTSLKSRIQVISRLL